MKANKFTKETGQEYHVYLAEDKIKRQLAQGEDRIRLSYVRIKDAKEAIGRLPLIPGMPVMISENLSMQNKIVNGTQGLLENIIYQTVLEGRHQENFNEKLISYTYDFNYPANPYTIYHNDIHIDHTI